MRYLVYSWFWSILIDHIVFRRIRYSVNPALPTLLVNSRKTRVDTLSFKSTSQRDRSLEDGWSGYSHRVLNANRT